jgi:chromosome segregation ATPase
MTTDERLDRLTERHQALAESLQLLTADVRSLAESTKELRQSTKDLAPSAKEHDRILRGHADLVGDLARVASAPEHRIQRLEERQG